MNLYTYRARSLAEALRLVRQELGPDASVLHTREVGGALSRWLSGRTIEVTASAEVEAPSRLPEAPAHEDQDPTPAPAELLDFRHQFRTGLLAADYSEPSLVEQLVEQSTQRCSTRSGLAGCLTSAGISESARARWLARLDAEPITGPDVDADRAKERLRQIIEADLPIRGPLRLAPAGPTVVALVGPTGVGKTTTLAKLAAHFRLREHRRVALIAGDTFRIGAVEQLRSYAEIMELPLEAVEAPRDIAAALVRLEQHDLILIDTPGRSPHDGERLLELRTLLTAAQPHETLLVASAAGGDESLSAAATAFRCLGATGLILTKLDESAQLGRLPDLLAACQLPLCYTTDGQNVPGDLRPATATHLAEALLCDS